MPCTAHHQRTRQRVFLSGSKNLLKNEKDSLIQKFLPVEMYLTYQVDGEPLEQLPNGYSDHYVPDGFVRD